MYSLKIGTILQGKYQVKSLVGRIPHVEYDSSSYVYLCTGLNGADYTIYEYYPFHFSCHVETVVLLCRSPNTQPDRSRRILKQGKASGGERIMALFSDIDRSLRRLAG